MTAPLTSADTTTDETAWMPCDTGAPGRFNSVFGPLLLRLEGAGQARVRMQLEEAHANRSSNLHGGAALAFIDVASISAARAFGLVEPGAAVTLDLSAQFIGAGMIGQPLDAVVELLRETRRLIFLRGLLVQGDRKVASFAVTFRKPTQTKPEGLSA